MQRDRLLFSIYIAPNSDEFNKKKTCPKNKKKDESINSVANEVYRIYFNTNGMNEW